MAGRTGTLTLDQLRALVDDGSVDTVLVAMTDMQGRLQGKRCSAEFFLDEVIAPASSTGWPTVS
jgi:glutamine synthetase